MIISDKPYYCYKILPLAYDDSLSYYEVLCKCTAKLNEVVKLINNVTDNSEEINDLSLKVNKNIADIDALKNDSEKINNDLNNLKIDYNKTKEIVNELNELIHNYNEYVEKRVNALDAKLTNKINAIQNDINTELFVIKKEIDKIITAIKKKYAIDVYNYSANRRLSLDNNNTKLYIDLENSISADEYDELGLTADDYKKYQLTALSYLRDSKKELHYDYVYMAISGTRQELNNALTEIFNTLQGTMTETEYEKLGLTADNYKDLNMNNTEYRSYNPFKTTGYIKLGGSGLTSKQYSELSVN